MDGERPAYSGTDSECLWGGCISGNAKAQAKIGHAQDLRRSKAKPINLRVLDACGHDRQQTVHLESLQFHCRRLESLLVEWARRFHTVLAGDEAIIVRAYQLPTA